MRARDFEELLNILACPNCYGALAASGVSPGDEVVSGELRCAGCGAAYPIRDSVLLLIVPDESWRCVLQEVVSWKAYEREQEFLKSTGRAAGGASRAEEHHQLFEKDRSAQFEEVFSHLNISAGMKVCEVAAFQCRQALAVAERGASVVATDAWLEPMIYGPAGEGGCRLMPKICCNAERLPFRSGSFDMAYVRTSIHHFERPVRALREMGRITRRGGRIVLVNEPSHYLLDALAREKVTGEDEAFLIGMNEQSPQFFIYLAGLLRGGARSPRITYFTPELAPWLRRGLMALGLNPDRVRARFFGGGAVRGLGALRLLVVHCAICAVAERGGRKVRPPGRVPRERLRFSIEEFFDRRLENLTMLWKRTLRPRGIPRAITVGANDLHHLRRGWHRAENIFGEATRWTRYIAYAFLRRGASDDALEIECRAPAAVPGRPVEGEVSVNGGGWMPFRIGSDRWEVLRFPLPPGGEEIIEVRIRTPEPWRGADIYPGKYDPRLYFGVAVRRLRLAGGSGALRG